MGFRYKFFPEADLLFMQAFGVLTDEDAIKSLAMYLDPLYRSGMKQLGLYSTTESIEVSAETVMKISDILRETAEERKEAKIALIGDTPLIYGLIRMYKSLSHDFPYTIEMFESMEEAMAWLCLDDAIKNQLKQKCT